MVGNNETEWVRVLDAHRVMKSEGQRVRESALFSSQQKKTEKAHFSHCRKSHFLYVWMCGARYEEEWKKDIHSYLRPRSHLILTSISRGANASCAIGSLDAFGGGRRHTWSSIYSVNANASCQRKTAYSCNHCKTCWRLLHSLPTSYIALKSTWKKKIQQIHKPIWQYCNIFTGHSNVKHKVASDFAYL